MLDNNGVHPITYTAKTAQKAYKEAEQAFKFELEEPQKVVDYFGVKLVVHKNVKAIATDSDLRIFAFDSTPTEAGDLWMNTDGDTTVLVGKMACAPNTDWWKESLIEV